MHPIRRIAVSILSLSLSATALSLALAQKNTSSPRQNPPASAPQSAGAPAGAPALTQTESLQLENLQLKSALLQQQFQQLQAQLGTLADNLTREHPGWRFDLRTQSFLRAPAAPTQKPEVRK